MSKIIANCGRFCKLWCHKLSSDTVSLRVKYKSTYSNDTENYIQHLLLMYCDDSTIKVVHFIIPIYRSP